MNIAVLSGKGGTGKTFVSVNLAASIINSIYVDCDVEEPNGHLFFKAPVEKETTVYTTVPYFNAELCDGCRACADFCRFNAIAMIKSKPLLFTEICHACGGCIMICPQAAITENKREVGKVQIGKTKENTVITGRLHIGEASAVPVIESALNTAFSLQKQTVIIDCPPGSSCSVMQSIKQADYCLLVVEPTVFGLHNFQMVYTLCNLLHKPCGIVLNKTESAFEQIDLFSKEQDIPVLLRIPFDKDIAKTVSDGQILSKENTQYATVFQNLFKEICRIRGERQ